MKALSFFIVLSFTAQTGLGQTSYAQHTFRIFPSNVTQTEPIVTVHPANPSILFASAVTINTQSGFKSEGVYVSTDGGLHWSGSDTCNGANIINHGGDPGVAIDTTGRLILTHIGDIFPGMYSHYSTDFGATWSSAFTISSEQPEDKGTIAIDNSKASPYYGRLYSAWVNFVSPYPVSFSYSTNSGESWSATSLINPSPPARCSGGSVTTGRDGMVYVCWAGVTNTVPFTEDLVGFAYSTDGGVKWNATQNIFDMNGINGTLSTKGNIRVNGLPQIAVDNSRGMRDGWLFIVSTEKNLSPAGSDPDIILHRSKDGGQSWSAGIRINQDSLNNGHIQYFPAVDIDSLGRITIVYYDDRYTTSDSAEIILAQSSDGGDTWAEHVISDHRFEPKPILGGSSNYQGDHIALTTIGNKVYAFWMDDYSGLYQVWLSIIDTTISAVETLSNNLPSDFELYQNYPNPFNPMTSIQYSVSSSQYISLKVYNVLGEEVTALVNKKEQAGSYSIQWNTDGFSSGVYFYRLTAGNIVKVRKMLLLR